MKIYVCETYHDNDEAVFSTLNAAIAYCVSDKYIEMLVEQIHEMELRGVEFVSTGVYSPKGLLDKKRTEFYMNRYNRRRVASA